MIGLDEFATFCQFVALISYLEWQRMEAEETSYVAGGGDVDPDILARVEEEASAIDWLLLEMREDKSAIENNLGKIPKEVREYLSSEEFVGDTVDKFNSVDRDGNGVLSPD